jgi:hypothetical protein
VSEDSISSFPAKNVLTNDNESFWHSDDRTSHFTLDLGCSSQAFGGVRLVNTDTKERATDKFELLGGPAAEGPWTTLLEENLTETAAFPFPETEVRFVKFQVVTFFGDGGGLQFFEVLPPNICAALDVSKASLNASFPL